MSGRSAVSAVRGRHPADDSLGQRAMHRNIAMDMKRPRVATIAGDAEIDHAIATVVLAFDAAPVARWMYDDPHRYLLHIPRLFRALGTSSFAAGAAQRTDDGLESRSGSRRVFTAMMCR